MEESFQICTDYPERIALDVGSETVTFGELAGRIESAAGDARKERVPILLPAESSIDFVVRFFSLLRAKCPVAVISPNLTDKEFRQRGDLLGRYIVLNRELDSVERRDFSDSRCHPDTAVVLFTSGSTGTPKAVQLSAANIAANTAAILAAIRFDAAPQQNLFLSLSYSYGLLGQLLPALYAGVPTRIIPRFIDARSKLMPGRAGGMWSAVPSQWKAILGFMGDTQLHDVTHVVSAGAPLPLSLRFRLRESFPNAEVYNNYGLTEASPRVLCLTSNHRCFFSESTGFPVRGFQARLSESGELCIKGPQVMLGYLGDPEGTAAKIVDGWLLTGDLAEINREGLVTIRGREDRIINLAGERTSLHEIEAALADLTGVAEATVLIEEDPTRDWRLVGFLVAEDDKTELSKSGVLKELSHHLSPAKIPRILYQLPSMPLNQRFKTDHSRLRELRPQLVLLK